MLHLIIALLLVFYTSVLGASGPGTLDILFWNVENLFHPADDSVAEDEEFLPGSPRHWTWERYNHKLSNIWKTLLSAKEEGLPDIIALCEIENRKVLNDLFLYSPLKYYSYRLVHYESPDRRGIDVCLVYNPLKLELLESRSILPVFSGSQGYTGRNILYCQFRWGQDSLHILVNHWPSKYGGSGITDIYRVTAARTVKSIIDPIFRRDSLSSILVCGDLNDGRDSRAIRVLTESTEGINRLICISGKGTQTEGTLKYQGRWMVYDHFLASPSLLGLSGVRIKSNYSRIYDPPFLLTRDERYGGTKPFRTWEGYTYTGGFSDHLPVILELERGSVVSRK